MNRMLRIGLILSLVLLPGGLLAQGTTGTLVGTVTSGGSPLPGVTVTISSPNMQGTRTAVTSDAGSYHFQSIPPGNYNVRFELEGMQTVNNRVTVGLAQTSRADADLRMEAIGESLTVTAAAPAVVETTQITANFSGQMINELPTGRDIREITLLAPSVSEGAVNDQITISGAMSFDNLFLVNGVVVNETLRGQPHELYIEDAIRETTVLTGGVSAEFGRFTGGVVSTLTKSGGNEFSGSFRDSLSNPSWTEKTDYAAQVDPLDELNETYEATLGGRIIHDRLWFFTAGRLQERETRQQLRLTEIPYTETRNNQRIEGKLTGQINPRHNVVASYLTSQNDEDNIVTFGPVVDERSLTTRTEDKTLLGLHYNGVLGTNLLLEGQFSRMDHDLIRGAETRDLIEGTLLRDARTGNRMWSPSGCGSPCGTKQHDNKSMLLKGSYFLSTRATGSHNLVGGFEEFHSYRADNNFQSGSDFWLHGHIIQNPADPTQLSWGIDPSNGEIEYDPVHQLSEMADFAVRSLFINDKWDLNSRWSFNIGVRYDEAFGNNQAGIETVDDSAISPRLAATFDVGGNGRHRLTGSYGRYVAKVEQGPADATATAGRYNYYLYDYEGPAINPRGTPWDQLLPVPEVIRRVFEWFNSVGGTANTDLLVDVSIPGYTSRLDDEMQSPWMDEVTVGYGLALSSRTFVRADLITRSWGDFYTLRRTLETGKATDPSGLVVDQGVLENSDEGLERTYRAVQLQGSWTPRDRLTLGGNYTWSELRGNVEGESASFATTTTANPDRPEYTKFERNNPVGYLGADMRHRANIWLRYDIETGFGKLNLSLMERYRSALSYSAVGSIDTRRNNTTGIPDGVVNPGYATVPSLVTYFFSERGEYRVDDVTSTDLGVNYSLPMGRVQFFVEADLLNLFNEQAVEDPDFINRTVSTRRTGGANSGLVAFNPFKGEEPVEGVNWRKSATFGQPLSAAAYQLPRTYQVSLGVRF